MTKNKTTVAIVGAGVGGLAVANLLAKAGYEVSVHEARSQLGGRMGMLAKDGFRFDTGPSWYLMPEVFDHFYEILGSSTKSQLKLTKLEPAYQVFLESEKNPLVITGDEKADAEMFERRETGAGEALINYLDSAEKIYKLALENFLYTTFESPRNFMGPGLLRHGPAMLKNAQQTMNKLTGKHFKDPGLRQILEYPSVFLGSSPFKVPAIYHLMSYLDFRQGVYYPQGGMYSVTESMVSIGRNLGVKFYLNKAVKAIEIQDKEATGLRMNDGSRILADIVISNADMHFTQTKLLPTHAQDYPSSYWKKRQAGPSALLMYLGVKGSLPQLKHHNLFFVKDWKENFAKIAEAKEWPIPASIYVCKSSQTDSSVAPKGHENVFVLVPLPANPNLHADKLEEYAELYIQQIAEQSGVIDFAERIVTKELYGPADFYNDYNSWKGTALGLGHELRQSAMLRPRTRSKKTKNLYYVGANVQPGIGVPMCLISAELVYKQITGDKTKGPIKGAIG